MADPLDELLARHEILVPCREAIMQAFMLLKTCFASGGKILLAGNGGSAADAEHWSGELLKSFTYDRPFTAPYRSELPEELTTILQGGLPAIPLTGFLSLTTAFGNDVNMVYAWAQLTATLGRPGDVLVGLSTSGNAQNLQHAFAVARAAGMKTLALTGRDGGALGQMADVEIRVPLDETYRIQEVHLPIYHTLSIMLEDALFPH